MKTTSFDVSYPDDMTQEEVLEELTWALKNGLIGQPSCFQNDITVTPSKKDIFSLLARIEAATIEELKYKTPQDLFLSAAEELGEVATEMAIEQKVHGHEHKKPDEGVAGESIDLFICALALYYSTGGTNENLIQYANKKMAKWESKT